MGVFDYENLQKTIADFKYIKLTDISHFSKANFLEISYDGIIYEQRSDTMLVAYDPTNNEPITRIVNKYNPVVDVNKTSEDVVRKILNNLTKNYNNIEFSYKTKRVGKTSEETNYNISKYFKLVKNTNLFLPIARSFHRSFPAKIFNNNIFKVTKLREEIFFIKLIIKQPFKSRIDTVLAVNDKTFWKRFSITYIGEDKFIPMTANDFDNSALELIDLCIMNPTEYSIKLRFIGEEEQKHLEHFEGIENPELEQDFVNPACSLVEFVGVTHYNKRTWLEILHGGYTGITYESSLDNPGLSSYKTPDSNTYYPGDDSAICSIYR